MTTIAWDGKVLAGDRQANSHGMAYAVTKVRRTRDGRLVGFSGEIGVGTLMLDWLEGGGERPAAQASDRCCTAIEIQPDGTCWVHGRDTRWQVEQPFFAIGSGRDFALAAMALGKGAAEAVGLAAQFDTATGSAVDTLELEALPRLGLAA